MANDERRSSTKSSVAPACKDTSTDEGCSSGSIFSSDWSPPTPEYLRNHSSFINSVINSSSGSGTSSTEEETESDGCLLSVGNLPSLSTSYLQRKLYELFVRIVPVYDCSVREGVFGPIATLTLKNISDARVAIAELHRRKPNSSWCDRRIELTLDSGPVDCSTLRARLRRLRCVLGDEPVTLKKLCDTYTARHVVLLSSKELEAVADTVTIYTENEERWARITGSAEGEQDWWRCMLHAPLSVHVDFEQILQPVNIDVATLSKRTYMLLHLHNGMLPLFSFVKCYEALFGAIPVDNSKGVVLELLLRSVPGVAIKNEPEKHLLWSKLDGDKKKNKKTAPQLQDMIKSFERELVDLLTHKKRCSIKFSEFIPAYHHHFWRQCRVADYGFTRLPELFEAVTDTVYVLGSGVWRLITLTPAAQALRWNSNILKVLRAVPSHQLKIKDIPKAYEQVWRRALQPADYGICTLFELLEYTSTYVAVFSENETMILNEAPGPSKVINSIKQLAAQAADVLRHEAALQMNINDFTIAYRNRFAIGYSNDELLNELRQACDNVVLAKDQNGNIMVRLAPEFAHIELANRIRAFLPSSISALVKVYEIRYGGEFPLAAVGASTPEEALWLCGCTLEGDSARAARGAWGSWMSAAVGVAGLVFTDRCIAPGSQREWVEGECIRRVGGSPPLRLLVLTKVIQTTDTSIALTPVWRVVMRAIQLVRPLRFFTPLSLFEMYAQQYHHALPVTDIGFSTPLAFVRAFPEIFVEEAPGKFSVLVSLAIVPTTTTCPSSEDLSLLDTPPGERGSRVFESPAASFLPKPNLLLRRRNLF